MQSQPIPSRRTPFSPPAHPDIFPLSSLDDDLALGCECANPALQIESWGEDERAGVPSALY